MSCVQKQREISDNGMIAKTREVWGSKTSVMEQVDYKQMAKHAPAMPIG